MHEWVVIIRLDQEQIDEMIFVLDTYDLVEAAKIVETKISNNVTLIGLRRII